MIYLGLLALRLQWSTSHPRRYKHNVYLIRFHSSVQQHGEASITRNMAFVLLIPLWFSLQHHGFSFVTANPPIFHLAFYHETIRTDTLLPLEIFENICARAGTALLARGLGFPEAS